MIAIFATLILNIQPPTLEDVYAKVRSLPGVEIKGEMAKPSVIALEFKVSPEGALWSKYPTSEAYLTQDGTVTWYPDRRQFAKGKPPEQNPLPAGFEPMWPKGALLAQTGDTQASTFEGGSAWRIPCRATLVPQVELFVDKRTLLPMGVVSTLGGTAYETRYMSVKPTRFTKAALGFVPPKDAKPFVAVDPTANLIKPGATLTDFAGMDIDGKRRSLRDLLNGRRGLLINLWFSACTGCVAEMPALVKLSAEYDARGVGFMGANPIDDATTARRTSKLRGLKFPTIVGKEAQKIADGIGVIAYPVTVVLDADRKVVDTIIGFDEPRLRKALDTVLAPRN